MSHSRLLFCLRSRVRWRLLEAQRRFRLAHLDSRILSLSHGRSPPRPGHPGLVSENGGRPLRLRGRGVLQTGVAAALRDRQAVAERSGGVVL